MAIELDTDIGSAKEPKPVRQKRGAKAAQAKAASTDIVLSNLTHAAIPYDATARGEMIAEAAYYLAEQRGFEPGHELEDWISAEREIDARLYGETHVF